MHFYSQYAFFNSKIHNPYNNVIAWCIVRFSVDILDQCNSRNNTRSFQSRYKEEQDTEDLDRMVKKVEKKLERSEARAAEAESELARTRSQITTCETDRVSWELSQSADNAEKLVKQMCNGIEGLRKIAASLASKNSRWGQLLWKLSLLIHLLFVFDGLFGLM